MEARMLLVIGLLSSRSVLGQADWQWPKEPKNLTELKGFSGDRLAPVMKGFTRALGVRCTHCHVGTEGKPLSSYDFVSNANPNKDRARGMLRMLGSINEQLKKIEPSGARRVNMWCDTCHRGRPRPLRLEDELAEEEGKSGVAGALARYKELKLKFESRGSYDFSERSLNEFGYHALGKKDTEGAIAVFRQMTSEFPASSNAWDSLGEAYVAAGQKDLARTSYRKSLELDPQNADAKKKLAELEPPPAKE